MNTRETECRSYRALNNLSPKGGMVFFGGSSDREIPVSELKQAFELNLNLCNRSLSGLTVREAPELWDACVAELEPEAALLRLGEAELNRYVEDKAGFLKDCRELISHIRSRNAGCEIMLLSHANTENSASLNKLNQDLRDLAASERCEFFDAAAPRVWNPAAIRETVSFLYSTGFVRPLRRKMPLFDVAKILCCYDSAPAPVPEAKTVSRKQARRGLGMPKASFV